MPGAPPSGVHGALSLIYLAEKTNTGMMTTHHPCVRGVCRSPCRCRSGSDYLQTGADAISCFALNTYWLTDRTQDWIDRKVQQEQSTD
ncbi:hypothetical protein CCHOA_03065 [Corynebacterium choanae]|uniref:Uncharacterized protein n=1 Tax=Corynebacterium choanae TaxID=1862358 RepID=A0A3G6J4Y6_9CORY|nr:hypothetical protein CCHOA_03065 [Corynebacterium choanae]